MKLRYSTKGWLTIAASVIAFEVFAPPGELLSEGMDRWRAHPAGKYLATGGILVTAAHLLRQLPSEVDPFTQAFRWKSGKLQSLKYLDT